MKMRLYRLLSLTLALALLTVGRRASPVVEAHISTQVGTTAYLPIVNKNFCPYPQPTGATYGSGTAYQQDTDNPVRPAYNHADKNLALRGYALASSGAPKTFVNYGSDDPTQPPQFATLFTPNRVPTFVNVYRANNWNWLPSPTPGTPGGPITNYPVTVLGLQTTPGEILYAPASGYDIGGGMEVIVMFADTDSITFKYTREDSVAPNGYTLHVDGVCVDPNLLALYNTLDNPAGSRYVYASTGYHTYSYNLPNLPAGQAFGRAGGNETKIAIVDSGAFQDPRSCNEWWQIRPSPPYACP